MQCVFVVFGWFSLRVGATLHCYNPQLAVNPAAVVISVKALDEFPDAVKKGILLSGGVAQFTIATLLLESTCSIFGIV